MEEKMIVIRDSKTFYSDLTFFKKNIVEKLKCEVEFIIKNNEPLAENKIKNEIEQLLLKFKNGNSIQEHGKQRNK